MKDIKKPIIIASDLEGVWIPEVWINLAEKTGIESLKLTTRNIKDYDALMQHRLKIMHRHKLTLSHIKDVIDKMDLLPRAKEFMDKIREKYQLIILSDTFYDFANSFMAKLDRPTLFCHTLLVNEQNQVTGYKLRVADGKRVAVEGFKKMGFYVISMGDSYNDISMLNVADKGILFNAPKNVCEDFPQYPAYDDYKKLLNYIDSL